MRMESWVPALAGTLLVLLLILPVAAADAGGHDQIIYISSYGPGYIWNQEIEAGIEAAITDSEHSRIQLSIEYLDAKVIRDTDHFENLYRTFAHKYESASPDAIIISDDAALLFMDMYGNQLFPGVPVVFTGINNASSLPRAGEKDAFYIGTVETLPIRETVDVIRAVNPETDTIYVILDNTYTGRSIRTQVEDQTEVYTDSLTILYPEPGDSISEIKADLTDLPDTAAVLIITYYLADQDLTPYHIDEISAELSLASPVPLYSAVSMFNNKGVVGGVQISPYDLGYNAANHALWVLEEKPLQDSGPVIYAPKTTPVFDYAEMQRFGISQSTLPAGATIINQPPDFVTVDRGVAFGVVSVALILAILAVILIVQNVTLSKTRALLTKSEHLYRSVVDGQTEMITRFHADGTIIFINPAYGRYFGIDPENARGTKFRANVHPDDRAKVAAHFAALHSGTPDQIIEQRIILDDGSIRWHRWDDHAISDEDGRIVEYQSVGMDITEQKEAEQKIQESLREKTVLLQEVHHRVKNNLAIISSMLEMQAMKEEVEEDEPYVAIQIREAERRISSMAAVHEELYQSESFGSVSVQSNFERLADEIIGSFPNAKTVTTVIDAGDCTLSLEKAIPVSLILNELLTNAMKYAFPGRTEGIITIQVQCNKAKVIFTFSDSGVGFPKGFEPEKATTIGIRMVKNFVEYQLDGNYHIATGPDGTTWTIQFPYDIN